MSEAKRFKDVIGDGIDGSYWRPLEIGTSIEGTISKIEDGDYGEEMELETPEGEFITLPSHKDLQSKYARLYEGDYIKVTLTKIIPSKNPQYNDKNIYRVQKEVSEGEE